MYVKILTQLIHSLKTGMLGVKNRHYFSQYTYCKIVNLSKYVCKYNVDDNIVVNIVITIYIIVNIYVNIDKCKCK